MTEVQPVAPTEWEHFLREKKVLLIELELQKGDRGRPLNKKKLVEDKDRVYEIRPRAILREHQLKTQTESMRHISKPF